MRRRNLGRYGLREVLDIALLDPGPEVGQDMTLDRMHIKLGPAVADRDLRTGTPVAQRRLDGRIPASDDEQPLAKAVVRTPETVTDVWQIVPRNAKRLWPVDIALGQDHVSRPVGVFRAPCPRAQQETSVLPLQVNHGLVGPDPEVILLDNGTQVGQAFPVCDALMVHALDRDPGDSYPLRRAENLLAAPPPGDGVPDLVCVAVDMVGANAPQRDGKLELDRP